MRQILCLAASVALFAGCGPDISGLKPDQLSQSYVLYDYYATWCMPCKQLEPELQKLHENYGSMVRVIRVDIDKEPEQASMKSVVAVPTLILSNGRVDVARMDGYQSYEQLVAWIHKVDREQQ